MLDWVAVALVALGGALGSAARYIVALLLLRAFPAGAVIGPAAATLVINITGSLVIGAWAGAAAAAGGGVPLRNSFVMAGICGGFTTFSAFSLQTVDLLRAGAPLAAAGNVVLSVLCCVAAAAGGYAMARG